MHGAKVIHGEAQLIGHGKIRVNGQEFIGEKMIVTNGAWAEKLLESLGVTFNIESQKTQILHLELPHDDPSKWPAIMLPNNKYIVGFSDHKVFVGSSHEDNYDFDATSTASGVYDILKTAFRFAPGLEEAKFIESRVGFRPMTPHKHPIITPLPDDDHLIVANGLGASGITSGPFLGSEIAKLALGEKNTLNMNDYQFESSSL